MKKLSFLAALLPLLFCACSSFIEENSAPIIPAISDLQAGFADETRTYVENGRYLRWHEDDRLTAFYGNTLNRQYKFKGKTGDNSGSFAHVPSGDLETGNAFDRIYALYPYNETTTITDEGEISLTLPAMQSYAENSFGRGANTMIAVTENLEDTFLAFKNACGYLKLKLYNADGATIKSIEVKGNNGEKIAGAATATIAFGDAPVLLMADDATDTITIDCGDGVSLGTTTETATEFWTVIPQTTFTKGITIKITDSQGGIFEKSTDNEVAITRNAIQPMAAVGVECETIVPETWKIYYTATAKVKPYSTIGFGANYVSNDWDESTSEGVITFDGEVTSIGDGAFRYSTLKSIHLPSKVTRINYSAFYGCASLHTVYLPQSLKYIGQYAFYNCQRLQHIYIEDIASWCSVEMFGVDSCPSYYGAYFYLNGEKITKLTIPSTVSTVEAYAFRCALIEDIIISDGVESLGLNAFYRGKINSIYIPNSITDLGGNTFELCSGELTINCDCTTKYIPTGSPFYRNYFTKINIGDQVRIIDDYLFNINSALTHLTIGTNVSSIGENSFYDTPCLKNITGKFASTDGRCLIVDNKLIAFAPAGISEYEIQEGVTELRQYILSYNNLTSIILPASISIIGNNAFYGCAKLESLYCKAVNPPRIGNSILNAGNYNDNYKIYVPYESLAAYKEAKGWEKYADYIVGYDFVNNTIVKDKPDNNEIWYTSTEKVIPYDETAFNASILTNKWNAETGKGVITFDKELSQIGMSAFKDQKSMITVTLPNNVASIGRYAFNGCGLTSFIFPTSLTEIGDCALSGCPIETLVCNIESNRLRIIEDDDYSYYTYKGIGVNSKTLNKIEGKYVSNDGKCLVINGTLYAFAGKDIPETYSLPSNITCITSYVMSGLEFKELELNATIYSGAFSTSKIDKLTLSGGYVSERSFNYGTIRELIIKNNVSVGYEAFNCDGESLYIDTSIVDGDWSDDYWPPYYYTRFNKITFGPNVKRIGKNAFNYKIDSVFSLPSTPPTLEWGAFWTDNVYVPASSVAAYKSAAGWSSYASNIVGYNF